MQAAEPRPISLVVDDDLARPRASVLLRALLAAPHVLVLAVWALAAAGVAVLNWLATTATGRSPTRLHRFLAGFLRYSTRVLAFVYLVAGPFPEVRLARPYAVDADVGAPRRQSRSSALLRPLAALPPVVLTSVFHVVMASVAFVAWFVALATARMPAGMRDLGAYCLRYHDETVGYLFLVSDRYPSLASPVTAR